MATEEHIRLANIIKNTHDNLRKSSQIFGPENAWKNHLKDDKTLQIYSEAMKNLAQVWEENASKEDSSAASRIEWIRNYCLSYFLIDKIICDKRSREERLMLVNNDKTNITNRYLNNIENIQLLDVGSCFNPFENFNKFNVIAIDLYPANKNVYKGDFLNINIANQLEINEKTNSIITLPKLGFECIVFSLLLEYIPSSEQRILCCKKAYDLLKFEGILIIITPDSQNLNKNAKLMKNWRYTLSKLGFIRIKFEKLQHITCMVFRKGLTEMISDKWADSHKEDYMTFDIFTPQDNPN